MALSISIVVYCDFLRVTAGEVADAAGLLMALMALL